MRVHNKNNERIEDVEHTAIFLSNYYGGFKGVTFFLLPYIFSKGENSPSLAVFIFLGFLLGALAEYLFIFRRNLLKHRLMLANGGYQYQHEVNSKIQELGLRRMFYSFWFTKKYREKMQDNFLAPVKKNSK